MKRVFLYSILAAWMAMAACATDNVSGPEFPPASQRGDIVTTRMVNLFSRDVIRSILDETAGADLSADSDLTIEYSVKVVEIDYLTCLPNGETAPASGALMIPRESAEALPLVSLQHGTQSKRDLTASVHPLNSPEGATGLIMSGTGYCVAVPDYLGFGVSEIMHPYFDRQSLTESVIDFLRAARSYCASEGIELNGELFLAGYSEGGYATLAVQQALETAHADEFTITASAPMGGPYDFEETITRVFSMGNYPDLVYVGYVFASFNHYHGWNRLNQIFRSPYAERVAYLYDGNYEWGEIAAQLPGALSQLMKTEFIQGIVQETDTITLNALRNNSLLDRIPIAPLHFFHGEADSIVPLFNAQNAYAVFSQGGANVELTVYQGLDHESAGLPCIMGMIEWFGQLRTK